MATEGAMIDHAQFTYTDQDMVATQSAGWTWYARWRNLLFAYLGLVVFSIIFLVAMNAAYSSPTTPGDRVFVVVAPVVMFAICFGLSLRSARNYARQMLHAENNRMLGAWSGSELGGDQVWSFDGNGLHLRSGPAHADLSWASIGAWLDMPKVLLLFPPGARAFRFTLPEEVLEAGWEDAPKLMIWPFGGHVLALPKRALAADDTDCLLEALRAAGVPERRRFGLIAARDARGNAPDIHHNRTRIQVDSRS